MKKLTFFVLFIALIFISGCNKDELRFTSSQIKNALFEMKGVYYGDMRVSYYHGDRISEGNECKVLSTDSLTIHMDLEPMAFTITDEAVASRLKEIGIAVVKAGYDFQQMDDTMFSFVLLPHNVVVSGDHGGQSPVRIVFDQSFGGDAFYYGHHSIMFNLSPIELWIGEEKYEPLQQLVYHYEGLMNDYTL